MIIIFNSHATKDNVQELISDIHAKGLKTNLSEGDNTTIVGVIGDTTKLDIDNLKSADYIADVKRVSEPYKKANRKMHPEDSYIKVTDKVTFGEGIFNVIAGPCSVETEEQIIEVAQDVKKSGATLLRGGAFKPRTSPYSFQGLAGEGLKLLLEAKKATGLPIVTEIMNLVHLDMFDDVDVIQVGARNMQNFDLLKELGKCNKPILLKRGLANTIEEWLMSAEYIMAGGNENVILCERGIRTFETATRNTLDIAAVPMLKHKTHLPVIIDPSHATGISWMVPQLAKTAVAAGADGLMVEVHNDPPKAWCDGAQSLNPQQFDDLMTDLKRRVEFEGKKIYI
ncbi:MAG: 3-deoxy-7-phosphoheptulonate synthase [Ruminococcus sp.]|nr:3-deoxy-7-phosphoheptulonate synthase [Ruminococcus sp.]